MPADPYHDMSTIEIAIFAADPRHYGPPPPAA